MNELCVIGNILWEDGSGANYSPIKYKKYVDHIIECKVCQKGLDMNAKDIEIIQHADELIPFFPPDKRGK